MRDERTCADGVADKDRERSCNGRSRRKAGGIVRVESEERRTLLEESR
jgi:hypothetical protein